MKNWLYFSLLTLLTAGCAAGNDVALTDVDQKDLLRSPVTGILVRRFVITVTDREKITGYLFEPESGKDCPALLYLHWLGGTENVDQSALEFYAEAADMARRGFVCAVPDGYFPWMSAPRGDERDIVLIDRQINENRLVLDLLERNGKVDKGRIGLVGHDYGGMHALLTASLDERVRALVVMTPVAEYQEWNRILTYIPDGEKLDLYRKSLATFDPVSTVGRRRGIPLLLQYSRFDEYVSEDNALTLIAAAGAATEVLWYDAGHELNRDQTAAKDRSGWILRNLR